MALWELTISRFRIIESTQGDIEIDGVSISEVPLNILRSRVAVIPQDSSMFAGTIRFNLDPKSVHEDSEIWTVLRHVPLEAYIEELPEKLSTLVQESGSNFSAGQRQLLSLAAALLRRTKIIVMDEATASVDIETDRVVQQMLSSDLLADKTVIAIAHRIETVLKFDLVLVLENGETAEFGSPRELMAKTGLFHDLVVEAGLQGQLS
jgi:ATP-binding cassette subfamily C (CFTR/MRP) protein 1